MATMSFWAVSGVPSSRTRRAVSARRSARTALRLNRTSIPSRRNTSARISATAGSSAGIRRGARWTIVTRAPNRARTCAISHPTGPPPSTSADSGSSGAV